MELASVLWITTDILLVLILLRAAKTRLWKSYPVFYAYVSYLLLVSGVRHIALMTLARQSVVYYYLYYVPTLLMPILHVWILWNLYCQIIGYNKKYSEHSRGLVTTTSVLTMPILSGVVLMGETDLFKLFHVLALFVQMVFCLQVCRVVIRASREVELGPNVKGLLVGLSVMVGLQAMNFVGSVFYQTPTPIFSFSVQFIYLLGLMMFSYGLWDEVPVRETNSDLSRRLRLAREQFYKASRSVLWERKG